MFDNTELFEREIKNLNERVLAKLNDGIRIGGCWNLKLKYNVNLYKQISWYFAGGLFGGSSENLIKFSELMKSKCLDIIKEKKTFVWEVNIWYLIYLENPDLFNCYMAGHDTSMITNY